VDAWQAIQYVGSGLSLVAFISAVGLFAYSAYLRSRTRIIQSLPAKDRIDEITTTAAAFRVDTSKLTRQQLEEVILAQIFQRGRRDLLLGIVAVIFAIILGGISILAILHPTDRHATTSSTVVTPSSPQPPGLTTITLNATNEKTAVDPNFNGNFREYVDPWNNSLLQVRKTDFRTARWDGPGEFRSALAFDITSIPRRATVDNAYLSVSVEDMEDLEHVSIDVYGFVGYQNLPAATEAFMGGIEVAGPIKALGQSDFTQRFAAIDVTPYIRDSVASGYAYIGFSFRQSGDTYSKGKPFGTGFAFRGRDFHAPGLQPHIVVRYRNT
jgi:hypothetical protein